MNDDTPRIRSTTILAVRKDGRTAIGGDGQVTLGNMMIKANARKVRSLADGKVKVGFAGSAADAFALLDRFEKKLSEHSNNITRAAIEMAKEWRTDRALRRLESTMIVADKDKILLLGGSGDVIEPDDEVISIGSGSGYATAAARALMRFSGLSAEEIVRESLNIAGDICIYTNNDIIVETSEEPVMSVDTVKEHLSRFGAAERVKVLPGSIATVELAAAGLGVEPDLIAKTLAVRLKGTDRVMVIVAKGTARLDNAKFKKAFSGKAMFVSQEECLEATGHPPGGVCPFGLAEGVEVYLDVSLRAFPVVYPAAGAPDNCVKTTLDELHAWTRGTWVDVCK